MIRTGAIVLGGVDLNNSLQWTNRFSWSPAQQANRRTLGGAQVIYQQTVLEGQPIILTATQDTGWLTKAMVDSLIALALVPATTHTFDFHGEIHSVKFSYGTDQAPISFVSLRAKQVLSASDFMIGTIKLFTV